MTVEGEVRAVSTDADLSEDELRSRLEAVQAENLQLADRAARLARENYGLLLILLDEVGDVSANAYRATAESKVCEAMGPPRAAPNMPTPGGRP